MFLSSSQLFSLIIRDTVEYMSEESESLTFSGCFVTIFDIEHFLLIVKELKLQDSVKFGSILQLP